MQSNKESSKDSHTIEDKQTNKGCKDRRKRIKRLKIVIIIVVALFLILPTIYCIILGTQVSRLQNQMNELLLLHEEYGVNNSSDDIYAYAAEMLFVSKTDEQSETEENQLSQDDSNSDLKNAANSVEAREALPSDAEETNLQSGQTSTVSDRGMGQAEKNESSGDGKEAAEDKNTVKTEKTKSEQEISSLKTGIYTGKKVYLTFDDGPSVYTDDILDILKEYKVKATFFVVGKTDDQSKKLYQRIVNEGHTLGMHSYSHIYSKIYNSIEDFDRDFTKLWKLLYDTTGYKPSIYRFPGGSDNLVNKNGMKEFIRYLNDASIVYFDWNVLNGDATGKEYTKEQLIDNVLDGVAGKENAIVLLHDAITKKTTVDSLPGLLEKLISEGAAMLPLNKDVPPIQMIEADAIN